MEDLKKDAKNKRLLGESFLDIRYANNINSNCITTSPVLKDWYISQFTRSGLLVKLEFTNPLYVSSGDEADQVQITVKNPYVFQSIESGEMMKMNLTRTF